MNSTSRIRNSLGAVVIATLATTGAVVAISTAQAAEPKPVISPPAAFDAPAGGKGGITSPVARCPNFRVEPRMRWVVTNVETSESDTYRWRGDGPAYYFPRLEPGTYRSKTTAWCNGHKAVQRHTDTIGEKTADTTVSRREFNRIRKGMTPAQVRNIVGYGGTSDGPYGGQVTRTYDMMAFWRWSLVTFRHGQVVDKYWDVGHD